MQRAQIKYGNKLQVVGLSVDMGYGSDAATARKSCGTIMAKNNVSWPNVFDPKGFDGVMRNFNISGYGLVLVDPIGIVRGIDIRVAQANLLLDKILKTAKR